MSSSNFIKYGIKDTKVKRLMAQQQSQFQRNTCNKKQGAE
jgi:hypothetical protein